MSVESSALNVERSAPHGAVFLSYASQDAEAAKRICEALRAAGVEVWFDQSELVGGDSWDAKIRGQIGSCALFVPVISAATQARGEGYFRLEWKLAVDRSHLMAHDQPFLLPVVIDATSDAAARVPTEFRAVQWTRLPGGETPQVFCARVQKLLSGSEPVGAALRRDSSEPSRHKAAPTIKPPSRSWSIPAIAAAALLIAVAAYIALRPHRSPDEIAKLLANVQTAAANAAAKSAPAAAAPLTEARKLERQARALIDDDPLAVQENFKIAYELCERATALSPDDGEIWATLARANISLIWNYAKSSDQKRSAARSQVERATRLAPESFEAALAMAVFELQAEDNVTAAKARLVRLVERNPNDARVLRLLINVEEGKGQDVAEAERWLARANALPGGDALAMVQVAWVYWVRNQLPELLALVNRSLALKPTADGYNLKLMALYTSGDLAAARSFLQQIPASILREDRAAEIAYEVRYYSREPEAALAVLAGISREILEEGRYFGLRGHLAGMALRLAGKPRAAEVEFRVALKALDERIAQNPHEARLMFHRARLLACLGDQTEAARQLDTARELGRAEMPDLQTCVLLGRVDEAIATLDKLIDRKRDRWPTAFLTMKYDPVFDPARNNPRFQEIIARGESWLREMMTAPAKTSGAAATESLANDKSVAVLAFADLSAAHDSEYFSDGISEELLNVLAKVPGLKVSARTSAFYFKGKEVPVPEIAKQLGVAYVVEGSVRKQGDKVRITAQLIKATDGFHVWSDTFTRDLKDIFAVQDEIAGLIAKNLSVQMGVVARVEHQVNPEALALLLEGRHFWALRSTEGFARAGELFSQAVKLDPQWAPAYAALASLQSIQGSYQRNRGEALGDLQARASQAARRAIELDPTLGEPYAALGHIAMDELRWSESGTLFAKALVLEPNNATVIDWNADLASGGGRLDDALAGYQRALELDPLAPFILWDASWFLLHARRYGEALALIERMAGLTSAGTGRVSVRRAFLLMKLGRRAEAESVLLPALPGLKLGWDGFIVHEAIECLRALGRQREAEQLAVEMLKLRPDDPSNGFILVALGRTDEAYAFLERTSPIMRQIIFWDPMLDPLRDNPRFRQVLEKLACTEGYKVARATLARMLREQGAKK